MERVAEYAGEAHSDRPVSAHEWLARACRTANDLLDDAARQLLAVLVEPLAASGELTVQYEDAVRVEIASSAVAEFPSPATAAVFVDAVKLAISRGLPTGRGDVEIPGQVQGSEALAHKLSARRAMENQRRIAEEREQRIRDFERVQAEEARICRKARCSTCERYGKKDSFRLHDFYDYDPNKTGTKADDLHWLERHSKERLKTYEERGYLVKIQ
jgi:hypothetical protein